MPIASSDTKVFNVRIVPQFQRSVKNLPAIDSFAFLWYE